jgi:hypothetical protein
MHEGGYDGLEQAYIQGIAVRLRSHHVHLESVESAGCRALAHRHPLPQLHFEREARLAPSGWLPLSSVITAG